MAETEVVGQLWVCKRCGDAYLDDGKGITPATEAFRKLHATQSCTPSPTPLSVDDTMHVLKGLVTMTPAKWAH